MAAHWTFSAVELSWAECEWCQPCNMLTSDYCTCTCTCALHKGKWMGHMKRPRYEFNSIKLVTLNYIELDKFPVGFFSPERPLGRFDLIVAMSINVSIYVSPPSVFFSEASHWPSDHMISSRPPSPPHFYLNFFWGGVGYSAAIFGWYWCFYPHPSRDSVSPVYGIFYF